MADMRIAVIGNSGGGKSVLARRLALELQLPCVEVDSLLWLPGWKLAPSTSFDQGHAHAIAGDRWVIEGLGARSSLPARLQRAPHCADRHATLGALLAGCRTARSLERRAARTSPRGKHGAD